MHAAGFLHRGSCCGVRCFRRCAGGNGQCLAGGRLERGAPGHPDLRLCFRLPLQRVARAQRACQTHPREAAPHGEHPGNKILRGKLVICTQIGYTDRNKGLLDSVM